MKYSSLKRQQQRVFKTGSLDGGLDTLNSPDLIADNNISECLNMWYEGSHLKTRPGFKCDIEKAVISNTYGSTGELTYKITDIPVYRYGEYYRVATSQVLSDDYVYYIYVYLIDVYGNIESIGHINFNRFDSDTFFVPTNVTFYSGKAQSGGGIFALIALENIENLSQKKYYIYEINQDFSNWERADDFYVPTVLINGRGNKYQIAKTETDFITEKPRILESQNMLNDKFYAYYTSDGYSSAFKLPFNNIANEEVSFKVYFMSDDYLEWVIPKDMIRGYQTYDGKEIIAYLNRDTGVIYFKHGGFDFPIPVMELCGENNIKVTAKRSIENGVANIVKASCTARHNSKLLLAGGKNGNTVYSADYDNPLYFPMSSSIDIGESTSPITYMSPQEDKLLVFKEHQLHLLSIKEGEALNQIALISDNGKAFKAADSLKTEQISNSVGCNKVDTIAICKGRNYWLGESNRLYRFELSGKRLSEVPISVKLSIDDFSIDTATAISGDEYYILVMENKLLVIDIKSYENPKTFLWQTPSDLEIKSGFQHSGEYIFLCTAENTETAFCVRLEGERDTALYRSPEGELEVINIPINSGFTTKHYCFGNKNSLKNILGISFVLAASGKTKISVNDRYKTELNFDFLNEDYDKCDYKSVKLSPHIYNTSGVSLKLESFDKISIGEIEFQYKVNK